jgi:multiple antibiotic resistance protein
MEPLKSTLLFLSALLPIVNPLGGSPIFLLLTRDFSTKDRTALSRQVAVNSFALLAVSYFVGSHILAFFGISLPVVQVGGGLVVISTGWAMLTRQEEGDRQSPEHHHVSHDDVFKNAFYPLTLPLTVGPGSISIAITLGANVPRHNGFALMPFVPALVGSFLVALSVFLCYASAERLGRLFGRTGMTVILRLTSFLLVCIGVQIMWNGISALATQLLARIH